MKECCKCQGAMIDASMYDPDGEKPLYGGHKEYDSSGKLVSWFVCINAKCEDGKRNSSVRDKLA